jgi:CheY-like chemotaxis protein
MTANVFQDDIERALACGMNSHIGKPIDFDKLLATLRRYLGGGISHNAGE